MSVKHPIIAVTGSSGAGTTTVCNAFAEVFRREKIIPFFVEGNSFRRYNREKMREVVAESMQRGRLISHFGPEVNLFDRLEGVFQEYSRTGSCLYRKYAENPEQAQQFRDGKTKVMGFFVGQLMKKTKGQANPQMANKLFQQELG